MRTTWDSKTYTSHARARNATAAHERSIPRGAPRVGQSRTSELSSIPIRSRGEPARFNRAAIISPLTEVPPRARAAHCAQGTHENGNGDELVAHTKSNGVESAAHVLKNMTHISASTKCTRSQHINTQHNAPIYADPLRGRQIDGAARLLYASGLTPQPNWHDAGTEAKQRKLTTGERRAHPESVAARARASRR